MHELANIMSRTNKKPYTGSKRFDTTCRNHGSCSWCYSNRMHKVLKKIRPIKEELNLDYYGKDNQDTI